MASIQQSALPLLFGLLAVTCTLLILSVRRSEPSVLLSMLAAEGKFGGHGTIPADVTEDWREINKDLGAFPYPDGSFFDSTNSDVWAGRGGNGEHSWLDPKKWVADRRTSHSKFHMDNKPEWANGQWWPRRYSDGVSPPDNFFGHLSVKQDGPEDLLEGMRQRYDNPTQDDYLDYQYHRLVELPHRQQAVGATLATVPDSVDQLDAEAAAAPQVINRIFSFPHEPQEAYFDKPAFPESFNQRN